MNDTQKYICRELLKLSYHHGFGLFPLKPIADKIGIKDVLYDSNTETGMLWNLGPHGEGLIIIGNDGASAGISFDTKELVEHWSDFKGV